MIKYIDPGTAGTIIGGSIWPAIITAIAGISAFFAKFFWNPLKQKISKKSETKED